MAHNEDKCQSKATDPEMTQMIELVKVKETNSHNKYTSYV